MTEKFEAETKVEFGVSHRECSDGFFAWGQIKNGTRAVLLRDRTLDRNRDWVITFDEARQLGALIDAAIRGAEVEHGKWIRREEARNEQ